jgi:LPXTG-motif cell wall-anchored protein
MSILNRRNALMGWAVWTVGKQVMKQKAKAATAVAPEGSRRNRAMLALGAVAAAAVTTLFFWRRRENGEDAGEPMG